MIENLQKLNKALQECEAVAIGAGAGLSTSAGLTYSGKRFYDNFADFEEKYGFHDMYSGSFYPFETSEERWAFFARDIFINRYQTPPKDTYKKLYDLVKDKNYFVITTNVDHQFQRAGFDKNRLFYTQGDYGLLQCSTPCHKKTYDNEELVLAMLQAEKDMKIPSSLIPRCPKCGKEMTMNLRCDDTFVEDNGWHRASERYSKFLQKNKGKKILFLELGVGYNTPVIIKYPFMRMTYQNKNAIYACVNFGDAGTIKEIETQSIVLKNDIDEVLSNMKEGK